MSPYTVIVGEWHWAPISHLHACGEFGICYYLYGRKYGYSVCIVYIPVKSSLELRALNCFPYHRDNYFSADGKLRLQEMAKTMRPGMCLKI